MTTTSGSDKNMFKNPSTDSNRSRESNPNSFHPVAEPIPVYRTRRAGLRQHIRPMRYREDMREFLIE